MEVIEAVNAHAALPLGIDYLLNEGSRSGRVLVAPTPVTTVYELPLERVIFWPERDADPFFCFYEGLWMLAGKDDVASLAPYDPRVAAFSDDGVTLHGAYGERWRHHFQIYLEDSMMGGSIDQLESIINMLKTTPEDQRCVLQMWDPAVDLSRRGRNIPCDTNIYFWIGGDGRLDMTVCSRSTDMILGSHAVHMSMLQEYVAAGVGVEVGVYNQMSNNYHAQVDTFEPLKDSFASSRYWYGYSNVYEEHDIRPYPMISTPLKQWREDLLMFLDEGVIIGLRDPFFRRVACPMVMAHRAFKTHTGLKKYDEPLRILERCDAGDWRLAAEQWIQRRRDKFIQKGENCD